MHHTHTWRIVNFSLLPQSKTDGVESLPYQVGRGSFKMRVFPKGRVHEADERVSVFIRCIALMPDDKLQQERKEDRRADAGGGSRGGGGGGAGGGEGDSLHAAAAGGGGGSRWPRSSAVSASSSSSSSSSLRRQSSTGPTLSVRYRFRYVHPSGDRSQDETIPPLHEAPYHYKFSADEEHEGAFVTQQSLQARQILRDDSLILQVDMEVSARSEFVFSHSLPLRSEDEQQEMQQIMGGQFLRAWKDGRDCDVMIRVKEQTVGGGGGGQSRGGAAGGAAIGAAGGLDYEEEENDDNEEEEDSSVQSEEKEDDDGPQRRTHAAVYTPHHLKKQRTSLTSAAPFSSRQSIASVNLIPAHKFVLSARSSVFACMLAYEMKERTESVIEIDDMDRETVLRMLYFLYTGALPTAQALTSAACSTSSSSSSSSSSPPRPAFASSSSSSSSSSRSSRYPLPSTSLLPPTILPSPLTSWLDTVHLFQAAHKYDIPHLAALTAHHVCSLLSDDTVMATLQLSEYYKEQTGSFTLFEAGREWMLRRFEDVVKWSCESRGGGDEVVVMLRRGGQAAEAQAWGEQREEEGKDELYADVRAKLEDGDIVDGCSVDVYADGEDENRALASLSLSATDSTRLTTPIASGCVLNAHWSESASSPLALVLITAVHAPDSVEQVTLPSASLSFPRSSPLAVNSVLPIRYANLRLTGGDGALVVVGSQPASASSQQPTDGSQGVLFQSSLSLPLSSSSSSGGVPALSSSTLLPVLSSAGSAGTPKRARPMSAGSDSGREGSTGKKRSRDGQQQLLI